MRFPSFCLAVLVLAACSSAPPAGPPRWSPNKLPPRDENFNGGPNAILLKHDANHDGTLTRDELIAGLRADFALADTGRKTCLDPAQAAAINDERLALDQATATPLQDWNQDGCIDYREFATTAYSLFDQTDRNRDAKITPQEFKPEGPQTGQGGPRGAPPAGPGGGNGPPPGR